ncbi:MAG: DNA primase, partial [Gammaproteobacteria bacterium]
MGRFVSLKRKGGHYFATCPFHQEKTASFSVNPQKQFFHCFGCGKSGDAIHFIREYEHLEFIPAVERLGSIFGLSVDLPTQGQAGFKPAENSKRKSAYALNQVVAAFFKQQLKTHAFSQHALDYLKGRGFNPEGPCFEQFGLGLAPPGKYNLSKYLEAEKADQMLAQDLGLLGKPQIYDKFRSRIIFPIQDLQGRVLGFGGRLLELESQKSQGDQSEQADWGAAKYLNSADSLIFHKGEVLFGLYQIRRYLSTSITQQMPILVTEGYLDVLSLMQAEIPAVASMGTALTEKQLQLLTKYYQNICFCFDGDAAGQRAAKKALDLIFPYLEDGLRVKFLSLPQGEDPDSYLRLKGRTAFLELLDKAQDIS